MSDSKVSLAVVSPDPTYGVRIRSLLADDDRGLEIRAEVTTPLTELSRDVVEQLRNSDVQVVFLDLGRDPGVGLRFARILSEASPARTFVLTGPAADPEILLEAMRVGASEYLPTPVEDADLAAALGRAARRLNVGAPREVRERGRALAVFSAKGGTGVSTTATNLAIQLHTATHRPTILVDLDLELGSAALYLGLQPRYSVLDVARNLHRMDPNLLASYVERHESGLHVLASPAQPSAGELLTREQVRSIVNLLRAQYEYVVIDLARAVTPMSLGAFETSDNIVLLTTPDLPTLRNTKKVLPVLERALGPAADRIRVVLNRRRSEDVITSADVASALGRDVFWSLENDADGVGVSLNEGKPVVLSPKSKYARDLRAMTSALAGPHKNGKSAAKGGRITGLLRRNHAEKNER